MALSTVNAPELTAEQVQRILIKPLEQASVFLDAGPRIFDVTAAGVVRIPRLVVPPSEVGDVGTRLGRSVT